MMRPLFTAALLAFLTAVGASALELGQSNSISHPDVVLPVFTFQEGGRVAVMCCCPPEWLRTIDDALYCSVPWHVFQEWAAEKEPGR